MAVNWRTLEAQVDALVVDQFGEPVRLVPMRGGAYAPRVPDPTRKAIEVTAIFETIGDRAMSLMADRAGQPFETRASVGDIRIQVRTSELADFNVAEGDIAVMLTRNNDRYEICRYAEGATGMMVLSLIRGAT